MDCAHGRRDGRPCVEFTWDGDDDGDRASGRGWAVVERDGSLRGHIYFHFGDDSGFRAVHARELDGLVEQDARYEEALGRAEELK